VPGPLGGGGALTCPVSTGGRTRRVQLVRGEGAGGGVACVARAGRDGGDLRLLRAWLRAACGSQLLYTQPKADPFESVTSLHSRMRIRSKASRPWSRPAGTTGSLRRTCTRGEGRGSLWWTLRRQRAPPPIPACPALHAAGRLSRPDGKSLCCHAPTSKVSVVTRRRQKSLFASCVHHHHNPVCCHKQR
jgi:hypothetical protein